MSDPAKLSLQEAIAQEKARLQERLEDLAEFERLAGKLNIDVPALAAALPIPAPVQVPREEPRSPFSFDGTFNSLIHCYRSDPRSQYPNLKHNVRSNYDALFNRIVADVGDERLADWNALRVRNVYEQQWAANNKLAMGRSVIGKLRLLCTYGSTVLDDDACTRLSSILGNMKFANFKPREERLTTDHAEAIIAAAHEAGFPSIAMAQAFQSDIPQLRQLDVIGEWVPSHEPGVSEIMRNAGQEKWVRGLRWSDIDSDFVLRRTLTSGRENEQKELVVDLKECSLVRVEIARFPHVRGGPVVVSENTGLPWVAQGFRQKWREIADKAGVPRSIRNADSGRKAKGETDLRAKAL